MMRHLLVLPALLALAAGPAGAQVTIDTPAGGWRSTPEKQDDFMQEVHYPAASVNVDGKSIAAQIRGQVAARPKPKADGSRDPARLVVDGVAMPLAVEEDGHFARPWSFGAGSHGIEVRLPDGTVKKRQFYEAQAGRVDEAIALLRSSAESRAPVELADLLIRQGRLVEAIASLPSISAQREQQEARARRHTEPNPFN